MNSQTDKLIGITITKDKIRLYLENSFNKNKSLTIIKEIYPNTINYLSLSDLITYEKGYREIYPNTISYLSLNN